jgi:hypothetical protein
MRIAVILLSLFFSTVAVFSGVQEGVLRDASFTRPANTEEASQSQADWYDLKKLVGAVDTANVITVSTYWGTSTGYLCKGMYNNSATTVTVRVATVNTPTPGAADTIPIKIDAYSYTSKLPAIAKIFDLGSTDSLLIFVQVRK